MRAEFSFDAETGIGQPPGAGRIFAHPGRVKVFAQFMFPAAALNTSKQDDPGARCAMTTGQAQDRLVARGRYSLRHPQAAHPRQ